MITQDIIDSFSDIKTPWGFNGLGYIVYKRTYARQMSNGQLEEWPQTIARCINGAQEIGTKLTKDEEIRLFKYMLELKALLGGRFLWQLGTETVKRYGKASLVNCWFVSIKEIDDFAFLMDMLLLGGGVGFSVKRENINELPKVKSNVTVSHKLTKDADFIVPDSREGWVKLLLETLRAYFKTGKSFTYSTILVRGAGEEIKGFGGKASGPLPLIDGIDRISVVLRNRAGKKLRSVDVLDICNIIGSIVVAGNVRRSAQIALGDADDYLFLHAKDWTNGTIPNHRAMSNNTIYADSYSYMSDDFWNGYAGNGEPYGLFNLALAQRKGRISDEDILDNCEGTNPCGEITLSSYESCVLAEIVLPNIESKEELQDIAQLLYKVQKAVAALPSHWQKTNDIVNKNMRIGLGVTGILQALDKIPWLDECYNELKEFDARWSDQRGWARSIKISTIKPSGTLSLLAGVTPGIHPAFSKFYIRRVRMASNDALVDYCKQSGFNVEFVRGFDGAIDYSTVVVEFPCKSSDGTMLAQDMTAVDQLSMVALLQRYWADNSVSCTVYYRKEELPDIKAWLEKNYEHSIKAISFLLHNEHGFEQAPYEEITEETYNTMLNKVSVTSSHDGLVGVIDDSDCESGACPIR